MIYHNSNRVSSFLLYSILLASSSNAKLASSVHHDSLKHRSAFSRLGGFHVCFFPLRLVAPPICSRVMLEMPSNLDAIDEFPPLLSKASVGLGVEGNCAELVSWISGLDVVVPRPFVAVVGWFCAVHCWKISCCS